ncbi:MAG: CBS domain-containing protein [Rhodocyclaceae bacterium]|nr:CBS domain-containing protein [Rhodocyclaceae bacterium]MDZ4215526.1 CBS domain-containing protein [Rhodocyclaceae bacterium]
MFYIQGIAGQEFKGSLEELGRVRAVSGVRAVGAVQPVGSYESIAAAAIEQGPGPQEEAIHAYRSMVQPDLDRGPLYHAGQIMRREVVTVLDTDRVAQAWRVLRDHDIRQAPVLDVGGRLVGIVGERDLLMTINVDGGEIFDILGRNVADVMTSPVVAAAPVTDLRRIARVMLDHDVDGVPILDETENLIGFISRSDILRAVIIDPPLSLWR